MPSIHGINETLARIRGVPVGTIEAYSRVLRREGVLPETKRGGAATPATPLHAARQLCAILRGSPIMAAANAREIGGLIANATSMDQPVLDRQLASLGWSDGVSFAEAVAFFIERYADGSVSDFIDGEGQFSIVVDRYWPSARLLWSPTLPLADAYIEGWKAAFADLPDPPLPPRRPDGLLREPMTIEFRSPILHEIKVSFQVDPERNRAAHKAWREQKARFAEIDVWGSESVTGKTMQALGALFGGSNDQP